jgi:Holliday junction resolvasome RuvABC endonuclease subunit
VTRILGLDISLVSTGYVLLDDDQVVWHGSVGSKTLRDVERLEMFDHWIREALHHQALPFGSATVDHVGVEGYSFASISHHHAIGELGGVIKLAVHQAGIPLHVIPPSTWKKALLGKGNLPKDMVRIEAWKRYGVEFASQDELDAWAVAMTLRRQLLGLDKPEPKNRKRKSPATLPLLDVANA